MVLGVIALVVALASLLWQVWTHFHPDRFDVRVTVRNPPVPVDAGEYELVVVVTNHGTTPETVEQIGLRFKGADDEAMNESTVVKTVDKLLSPNANVRLEWDLGEQRFAVGRTYRGWAKLATGVVIESEPQDFDPFSLHLAGLSHAVRPEPSIEEIEAAAPPRQERDA